jgi:PAS domain S-box-containing protein
VRDVDGNQIAAAHILRDVTEQVAMDHALRESETRFRDLADSAPAMFWVTDREHSATFLSRGWSDHTGQNMSDALGFGWINAVHPDDRERTRSTFIKAAEHYESFQLDYRLKTSEGDYRWAADLGRPRFNREGEFVYINFLFCFFFFVTTLWSCGSFQSCVGGFGVGGGFRWR